MSYGLNIEMHKQVSSFFIIILNDSKTSALRKEICLFVVFLWYICHFYLYLKRLGMSEKVSFLHVVPHVPYYPDF